MWSEIAKCIILCKIMIREIQRVDDNMKKEFQTCPCEISRHSDVKETENILTKTYID